MQEQTAVDDTFTTDPAVQLRMLKEEAREASERYAMLMLGVVGAGAAEAVLAELDELSHSFKAPTLDRAWQDLRKVSGSVGVREGGDA